MDTFISEVARKLWHSHGADMSRVVVVFNNRRPSLFLRRELQQLWSTDGANSECESADTQAREGFRELVQDPSRACASGNASTRAASVLFLPQMIGFDDLINRMSDLHTVQKEFLLFELYDIYRSLEQPSQCQPFEDFISLADMILSDFSELDLYMCNAQELFSNLHAIKSIDAWSPSQPKPTALQENYLRFFKSMYAYYERLRARLLVEGKAYSGMIYRDVAEHIDARKRRLTAENIYFVGFNVLSTCERMIIDTLVKDGRAELICDADSYYVDDWNQEAGHFLRLLRQDYPQFVKPQNYWSGVVSPANADGGEAQKVIDIVDCPENLLQVKYAAKLIAERCGSSHGDTQTVADEQHSASTDTTLERTAVVLADESLLVPLLNSLPSAVSKVNITMGYPYSSSLVHALMMKLLALYQHSKEQKYYHSDLLLLLSDPLVARLAGGKDVYPRLQSALTELQHVYLDISQVDKLSSMTGCNFAPLRFIFECSANHETPEGIDAIIANAKHLVQTLYETSSITHLLEREAAACFVQIADYMQQLQQQYHYISTILSLQKIYERLSRKRSIALEGEPLGGLQVLGMLETRNLDFDNLIILSLCEGILPTGRTDNSIVPHLLKVANGLPTYADHDAVYAYHFYRLLQRAKHITLIHHSDMSGLNKGLPSRFLLQLQYEVAQHLPNVKLRKHTVSVDTTITTPQFLPEAKKTNPVMQWLNSRAKEGFSPSILNDYCDCPMKFYYIHVLRAKQPDEFNEELSATDFGKCIHSILEKVHASAHAEPLKVAHIDAVLKQADELVDAYFDSYLVNGRSSEGRNYYHRSIAKIQVREFLEKEKKALKEGHVIELLSVEKKFIKELTFSITGKTCAVNLQGVVDRIDRYDGTTRLLDYKTGNTKKEDLKAVIDDDNASVPHYAFQLLTYAWMLRSDRLWNDKLIAGVVPLAKTKQELFELSFDEYDSLNNEVIDRFEDYLKSLMSELMNVDQPFITTPSTDSCHFCPAKPTCPVAKS